jgi:hypothetical protein
MIQFLKGHYGNEDSSPMIVTEASDGIDGRMEEILNRIEKAVLVALLVA